MDTKVEIQKIRPAEIEKESFRLIEEELGATDFSPQEFAIVRRVIHATGDFEFARNIRIHHSAIKNAIEQIKNGKNVLTDVQMVAAGINKKLLGKWGGSVVCNISATGIAELAKKTETTRAEAAIEKGLSENIGVVAIGNAPTALLRTIEVMKNTTAQQCLPVVIGVPVGFVNAAESKDLLAGCTFPHITSLGRKGGSPVAAAIVNALLWLAEE